MRKRRSRGVKAEKWEQDIWWPLTLTSAFLLSKVLAAAMTSTGKITSQRWRWAETEVKQKLLFSVIHNICYIVNLNWWFEIELNWWKILYLPLKSQWLSWDNLKSWGCLSTWLIKPKTWTGFSTAALWVSQQGNTATSRMHQYCMSNWSIHCSYSITHPKSSF